MVLLCCGYIWVVFCWDGVGGGVFVGIGGGGVWGFLGVGRVGIWLGFGGDVVGFFWGVGGVGEVGVWVVGDEGGCGEWWVMCRVGCRFVVVWYVKLSVIEIVMCYIVGDEMWRLKREWLLIKYLDLVIRKVIEIVSLIM